MSRLRKANRHRGGYVPGMERATPYKLGAKQSRDDPQPNHAPTGKRRRQWR